jgi:hypothetical protein
MTGYLFYSQNPDDKMLNRFGPERNLNEIITWIDQDPTTRRTSVVWIDPLTKFKELLNTV